MRYFFPVVCILLICSGFAGISSDRSLNKETLSGFQISNLAAFCKVWGFLKYYHPWPSKKKTDWDEVLISNYPLVKNAANKEEFNRVIAAMIAKTKALKPNKHPFKAPDSLSINVDFKWLADTTVLDYSNSAFLQSVLANHEPFRNKYISAMPFTGNPKFYEKEYADMVYPDEAYRFLALARYWNAIEYFFPGKYLMDTDWDITFAEAVPQFLNAKDRNEYRLAIQWTTARINDGHGFVKSPWQYTTRYPAITTFYSNDTLYVTGFGNDSLARFTDLRQGDTIVAINGTTVKDRWKFLNEHSSSSNESYAMYRFANSSLMINSGLDSSVFSVVRSRKVVDIKIRNYYPGEIFRLWKTPEHKVQKKTGMYTDPVSQKPYACINMKTLKKNQVDSLFSAFGNVEHLILEARNYPSEMGAWILLANKIVYPRQGIARMSFPDYDHPGYLKFSQVGLKVGTDAENYFKVKVYILVDHSTMSQAEYETMALRLAPQATVIGTQTAGADGNVSTVVLPGNYTSTFSGLGWYYADGRQTQRIGIVPDLKVEYTLQTELAHRDPIMEKTMELIRK